MLELKNISKRFTPRIIAVDNLSFEIAAGEFISVLGPSGCGKTTLLRLIAGLEVPDAGEVWISGRRVSSPQNTIAANERGIGMVFQHLALWPHMRVLGNIIFALESQRMTKRERRQKSVHILNTVGLTRHINFYPHHLSGGEQQRVALARALVLEPKFLLMDEPLSDLDLHLKAELEKVIIGLHKKFKITTIYVTHNQDEAFSMSDRIIVMNRGRIEQIGKVQDIRFNPHTDFVKIFVKRQA
ncbi:MAG: ABC transporter ATP-binding protein [Candidatus Omnitrophota bacterium]